MPILVAVFLTCQPVWESWLELGDGKSAKLKIKLLVYLMVYLLVQST